MTADTGVSEVNISLELSQLLLSVIVFATHIYLFVVNQIELLIQSGL